MDRNPSKVLGIQAARADANKNHERHAPRHVSTPPTASTSAIPVRHF